MHRCACLLRRALLLTAAALVLPVQAQPVRNFPRNALRGDLVFTVPPQVVLNGQAARLAPGARVHGQNNMLQMSGALAGQTWVANYTADAAGQVHEVWLLRPDEAARQPWPRTSAEARSWSFDGQVWTKP